MAQSRFVIWLGRQESQGIALQEALATNTPVLVWDVVRLGDWQASPDEMAFFSDAENFAKATCAEYFDERCGLSVRTADELPDALEEMDRRLEEFSPRAYILEELTLAKKARDFVAIYDEHFGPQTSQPDERLRGGNWVNRSLTHRVSVAHDDLTRALHTRVRRFASKLAP